MDNMDELFRGETLSEISRAAGEQVSQQQVRDVLQAVLPQLRESAERGELAQRAATGGDRGSAMNVLSLLLGGNSGNAVSAASQSTGVSQSAVSSILKAAAPILLALLLKDSGSAGNGSLLGNLLGGGQQQGGAGLLGSLLGGNASAGQSGGAGLLGSLLGGGSASGGDLLGSFVSLLADDGEKKPAAKKPAAKKPAAKKPAAKKPSAKKPAAKKPAAKKPAAKKPAAKKPAAKKPAAKKPAAKKTTE